jgi:hypothetical protein
MSRLEEIAERLTAIERLLAGLRNPSASAGGLSPAGEEPGEAEPPAAQA